MPVRRTSALLASAAVAASVALTAAPAHAAVAPTITDAYTTPVVTLGITKVKDSLYVADTRDATAVKVRAERATAGLCAGFSDALTNRGPLDDPTVTEFGDRFETGAQDFVEYGGNGCAGRWKVTYTATGPGGTASKVNYQYILRASRFLSTNAAPEPIKAGTAVTTSALLQRASFADLKYHGWAATPVELQFRTTGAWKTYRTLTSSSTGVVRGTVAQRVTGCWRLVTAGTSTTAPVESLADCVTVR